jgi:alkaline phosphatase D
VASQKMFLDFLDEPQDSPRRNRMGLYNSYTYGPAGKKLKIILLDNRYFRDVLGSGGDMLGDAQWQWLEEELKNSDAQIHLISSGIQILPIDKPLQEKWVSDAFLSLINNSWQGRFP